MHFRPRADGRGYFPAFVTSRMADTIESLVCDSVRLRDCPRG